MNISILLISHIPAASSSMSVQGSTNPLMRAQVSTIRNQSGNLVRLPFPMTHRAADEYAAAVTKCNELGATLCAIRQHHAMLSARIQLFWAANLKFYTESKTRTFVLETSPICATYDEATMYYEQSKHVDMLYNKAWREMMATYNLPDDY